MCKGLMWFGYISFLADEIIITDTGSSDNTIKIAKDFTKKIKHFNWIDDFSAARNFTDQFATQDYILRWDGDWILNSESIQKLKELKAKNFYHKDLIYFDWILDFDKKTLKPIQSEPYFFLYKNKSFYWQSPIHNDLIPNNPKKKISTYVDQSIKVFHYKDPLIKKARYLQTDKILKKTLPTLSPKNYNYYRLLKFFAQNLIFLKKFNEAIEPLQKCLQNTTSNDDKACLLLEQLIFCYIQTKQLDKAIVVIDNFGTKHKQRFWLSYGDIYSLVDPTKSIKAYQKAIQIGPDSYDYNIERMLIHPHLMLAKIYLLTNQLDESKTHLDFCIQNSHNSNSILECKQIKTLIAKTI